MRYLIPLLLALPLSAVCPSTITCDYHNYHGALRVSSGWRNGKQFATYQHPYTENGRRQICMLRIECP